MYLHRSTPARLLLLHGKGLMLISKAWLAVFGDIVAAALPGAGHVRLTSFKADFVISHCALAWAE